MSRYKPFIIIIVFVVISLYTGSYIRNSIIGFSTGLIKSYDNALAYVKHKIEDHFNQAAEIQRLREENKELRKSAVLLSTFANELDQILVDKNSSKYEPNIQLVRTLSYADVSDYNKFWIDFKDFNKSKVYGIIYQGKTAGIVINKDDKPLAILQRDNKSSFSVYVGDSKIPGIAIGNTKDITVKFIPQWLNPKVGDEVYTSGLDGIFFTGIPVGKVEEIKDENLYKSAIVKPYSNPNMPSFLYVVTKEY